MPSTLQSKYKMSQKYIKKSLEMLQLKCMTSNLHEHFGINLLQINLHYDVRNFS